MAENFDRFTEGARTVLTLAQAEARRLDHTHIGTEHLLLAVVRDEDGLGARVLSDLGIPLPEVRSAVEVVVAREAAEEPVQIGLTPRAKKVIELAVDEARQLGHHSVGSEHLLLGLVREGGGIAGGVLETMRVDLDRARAAVIRALGDDPVGNR